jgi:hypothetical protein
VARSAHLGAHEHGLVIALVFLRIDVLVRNVLPEHLTCVRIRRDRGIVGGERTGWLKFGARLRANGGVVLVAAALEVVEWSIAGRAVGVANRAEDPALPRFGDTGWPC